MASLLRITLALVLSVVAGCAAPAAGPGAAEAAQSSTPALRMNQLQTIGTASFRCNPVVAPAGCAPEALDPISATR